MELEDLKQKWNMLDERLSKSEAYNKRALEEVIKGKNKTTYEKLQKQGMFNFYLSILFGADSFSDLLARIDMISEIMESDKRLEEEYIATRKEVQQIKADYEKAQADMEEKKADLEVEVAELEKQIAQLPCDILIVAMHNYSPEFLDSFTKVLRIRDGEVIM